MAEGLERLRRMTSDENTVSVDLSIAVPSCATNHEKPVIRRPVEIPSTTANPFPWRRVAETSGEHVEALIRSSGRDAVTVADPRPGGFGRGSIDMNEVPCLNECGFNVDSSPPTSISIISGFPPGAVRVVDCVPPSTMFKRELALDIAVDREASSRTSDEEDTGGATRKKLRLSKDQSSLLEESFREHSTLNPKHKNALAKKLNLRPRQVEVWFQNRRARTKLKQTEVDCEALKRCCENLTEENRRLERELQELRALKVAPPCVISHDLYMQPLAAATLTMCPSCERIASMDNTANRTLTFSKPRRLPHFTQQSAAC